MNELGLVELICEECRMVYVVRNPSLDEIDWPTCPNCRRKLVGEPDNDDTQPLNRVD